jgi:hypothetical protein
VVDLVLEAHGLEPLGVDHQLLAVEILRLQTHALGALHLGLEVRHRQAAFGPGHRSLPVHDLGIHEHQRVAIGILLGPLGVHHHQAHGLAHLRRREPDAGLVVHHLEHVPRQRADLVGERLDRRGDAPEPLVGKLEHLAVGHAESVPETAESARRARRCRGPRS